MLRETDQITHYADTAAAPVLIVSEPAFSGDATIAVELAGGRVLDRINWPAIGAGLGRYAATPVMLIEAEGTDDDILTEELPAIAQWSALRDVNVIVTLGVEQIDIVTAQLFAGRVQLLCTPTLADRVAAVALAIGVSESALLHDSWREGDAARLRHLSEEIARIARILVRLAQNERLPNSDGDFADRRICYDAGPASDDIVDARDIRRTIQARRLRDQFFGAALFEEPAWDMLLDLYAAELEGTRVSVSSLCIAAAVAPTTALRWIAKLTERGLMVRDRDPIDRRRAFITLSSEASAAMQAYLIAVKRSDL